MYQCRRIIHNAARSRSRERIGYEGNKLECDVAIAGGGVCGLAMAHRLAQTFLPEKIKIVVISTTCNTTSNNNYQNNSDSEAVPSPRAYALSPSSLNTLGYEPTKRLEQWRRMALYHRMQIWESDGPAVLQFTDQDLNNSSSSLGAVVEDEAIVAALSDVLRNEHQDNVNIISNAVVTKVMMRPPVQSIDDRIRLTCRSTKKKKESNDEASEDIELSAKLLVAADGGNSFVRNSLGMPTIGFGYNRKSVICTVRLQHDDSTSSPSSRTTAFQRFFPNGPIALLPTHNPNFGNIVWSTTPDEADRLTQCSNDEFVSEINSLLQEGPTLSPPLFRNSESYYNSLPPFMSSALKDLENVGQSVGSGLSLLAGSSNGQGSFQFPPVISSIESRRFSFDLKLQHAQQYVGARVALVGDAAHTIHPMAGQGLNLGLADVESLTKYLKMAQDSGTDLGSSRFLRMYESERQKAAVAMMGGIQFLHGAFSTELSPLVYLRSIGMNFVNATTPVRRTLANIAAGNTGASIVSSKP